MMTLPPRFDSVRYSLFILIFIALVASSSGLPAAPGKPRAGTDPSGSLVIDNGRIRLTVVLDGNSLKSEVLEGTADWAGQARSRTIPRLTSDGDFGLEVMYTDWQAPGKFDNADNPVMLTKKNFSVVGRKIRTLPGTVRELSIDFHGTDNPLTLRLTYRLDSAAWYIRRNIAVMDTSFGHHFLRWIWVRRDTVSGIGSLVKPGGFGQPVAYLSGRTGGFTGIEYPAAENHAIPAGKKLTRIDCGHESGERIGKAWITSEWAVEGLTPDENVRLWFFRYLDSQRIAALKPYTLYNSWYDLRSPEYPRTPPEHFMSEESSMRMIRLLRENMIDKHGIHLDAFVLDDGWDVYESDWKLRPEQFPHGLKPIADTLRSTNTTLGVWFGPIGGYSFRKRRIAWMKDHGYEVVGDQLCAAGKNYSALFRQRVTDFTANDGVGYYKWDGIQFSCSEPDHGHPVDLYSRRAVMKSVENWCASVREKNPSAFLNITSGTWLSPWWVKYANTIWMQGEDYGYSDVPSISQRDAAITYRDFVLYDDLRNQDSWFPIANLMTHGIIKGKLELLGSPEEPLDKFTDDVLLYVARGVSMYELYISPDILTEGEWNSIASALSWARDRFPVLESTVMVGGNPMKREPYGYAHFAGSRGIIAVRNPFIEPKSLTIRLDPSAGLDPAASSLVLERVYPTGRISPKLCSAGESITVQLDGYETALYELYPLSEATEPLVAGTDFEILNRSGDGYSIRLHDPSPDIRLLNPAMVASARIGGRVIDPKHPSLSVPRVPPVAGNYSVKGESDGQSVRIQFDCADSTRDGAIAVLLTPDTAGPKTPKPVVTATIDNKPVDVKREEQEGKSQWNTIPVIPGRHQLLLDIHPGKNESGWKGVLDAWLVTRQIQPGTDMTFTLKNAVTPRPMPPHPWNPSEVRRSVCLGHQPVAVRSSEH